MKPALFKHVIGSLSSPLRKAELTAYFRQNVRTVLPHAFNVRLSIGIGEDFVLEAREFLPTRLCRSQSIGVEIDSASGVSRLVTLRTAFITPFFVSSHDEVRKINLWLEEILEFKLDEWPRFSTAGEKSSLCREVLTAICQFYKDGEHSDDLESQERYFSQAALKRALKLSILCFLLSHQFQIPEREYESVNSNLSNHHSSFQKGPMAPWMVSRVIKGIIVSMFQTIVRRLFEDIHRMLQVEGAMNWAYNFCVNLILIMVASEVQVSMSDLIATAKARPNFHFNVKGALQEVQCLEEDLLGTLATAFHQRLVKQFGAGPSALLDQIQSGTSNERGSALFSAVLRAHEMHGTVFYVNLFALTCKRAA
jgi:hypothetical protein